MSLSDIRREYLGEPLDETHSDPDPFKQFAAWFEQVRGLEQDPTAMALATATKNGRPSVRTVLLKSVDDRGFVFFTNYGSRKARELTANPRAALCQHWPSIEEQIRVEGPVEMVDPAPGERFDPATMEAVLRVPADAPDQDDTVHQVFQKGYRFRTHLVRPARVSVRKHE